MRHSARVVLAVVVGALVGAGVYTVLWASPVLAVGVFVSYAVGAWAFADSYGDWPDAEESDRLQAAFPAFALTAALLGVPATLPTDQRFALVALVFGAAYGGIFLGITWMVRATAAR